MENRINFTSQYLVLSTAQFLNMNCTIVFGTAYFVRNCTLKKPLFYAFMCLIQRRMVYTLSLECLLYCVSLQKWSWNDSGLSGKDTTALCCWVESVEWKGRNGCVTNVSMHHTSYCSKMIYFFTQITDHIMRPFRIFWSSSLGNMVDPDCPCLSHIKA